MKTNYLSISVYLLFFFISGCASDFLWVEDGRKIETLYKISGKNSGSYNSRKRGNDKLCISYSLDDSSKFKSDNYPPLDHGCICHTGSNSHYLKIIEQIINGPVSIDVTKISAVFTKILMLRRNFGAKALDKVILARDLDPESDGYIKMCKGEPEYNLHWEINANLPSNWITFNVSKEQHFVEPNKENIGLIQSYYELIEDKVFEKYKEEYHDDHLIPYHAMEPLGWIKRTKAKTNGKTGEKVYAGFLLGVGRKDLKQIQILFDDKDADQKNVNLVLGDSCRSYSFSSVVFENECDQSAHLTEKYPVLQKYPLDCVFRLQRMGYKYSLPTRLLLTPIALGIDILIFPLVSLIGFSGCGPPP